MFVVADKFVCILRFEQTRAQQTRALRGTQFNNVPIIICKFTCGKGGEPLTSRHLVRRTHVTPMFFFCFFCFVFSNLILLQLKYTFSYRNYSTMEMFSFLSSFKFYRNLAFSQKSLSLTQMGISSNLFQNSPTFNLFLFLSLIHGHHFFWGGGHFFKRPFWSPAVFTIQKLWWP